MMFASKTPRDLNRDPEPYASFAFGTGYVTARWETPEQVDLYTEYRPRPEFDHAQHNEPNPILIEFRKYANIVAGHEWPLTPPQLAAHWTQNDDMWCEVTLDDHDNPVGTPAQVAHARRVLERLARYENA